MKGASLVLGKDLSNILISHALNLISSLLVVRLLTVEEYSSLTFALSLISTLSMLANLGLSQAVTSIGSLHISDKPFLYALLNDTILLSRNLAFPAAFITLVIFARSPLSSQLDPLQSLLLFALILAIGRSQNLISIYQALFSVVNRSHLTTSTVLLSSLKLVFLVSCLIAPLYSVVLLAILASLTLTQLFLVNKKKCFFRSRADHIYNTRPQLLAFIRPIIIVCIFTSFQSQLSVLILGLQGLTSSVADLGALNRLVSVFSIFTGINLYFVQPYFARITCRQRFTNNVIIVLALLSAFCVLLLASVLLFPYPWLLILGEKYMSLTNELIVSMICVITTILGTTLYTLVISTRFTRYQSWPVLLMFPAQTIYLLLFPVNSTLNALYFNLLPSIVYAIFQGSLLLYTLKSSDFNLE